MTTKTAGKNYKKCKKIIWPGHSSVLKPSIRNRV